MSDKRRRKSLSIFRPALSALSSVHDGSSSDGPKPFGKKNRAASFFAAQPSPSASSPSSPLIEVTNAQSGERVESPKIRPKTLQKASRTSVFGSLRSLHSWDDEEKLTQTTSKGSSADEEEYMGSPTKGLLGTIVLHHGEVQTTGGMFRKRSQYLVLTETHLVRFKSQSRASEMFPSIPASLGRSNTTRQSIASIGSFQEMQMAAYADITSGIPLNHIVAVYKLDDGRPYFSIEVSHMDEKTNRAASMHMQLNDPRESDLWLTAIRAATNKAKYSDPASFSQRTVEYVARTLGHERDYDPEHFHIFKVVQRASNKAAGRSSSDDLAKLSSTICYLALGLNKIHLVPLARPSNRASSTSLTELDSVMSFGIMTLAALSLQNTDDAFQLTFRVPLRSSFAVHLASLFAGEIALWIRQSAEYLRPEWLQQPFTFKVPRSLEDQELPTGNVDEDHRGFDRTLVAYCAGFDIDTSNIRYTIDYDCEDAPCFRLVPPASIRRQKYTALELLAVMRALRYNESFTSISFNGMNLDVLHDLYDAYGPDPDAMKTRSGSAVNIVGQENMCLLSQEVRALALKSKRLRRLDFSFCVSRIPQSEKGILDPGCGIPEAIFPLCRRQLTNVDWVILNGIKLGDSDLDYLVDAASQRVCHLRALEVSNCGLYVHDLDLILSTITAQENTLEAVDISGVQGRLSPELFQQQIGYFGHIRKINLTRVQRTTGPEPLIAPETLLNWRLEELSLSQTAVNEQTVDSISAYLASPKSDTLRELRLDQCGLAGKDVAVFMRSMARERGKARNLHLHVSENRLSNDYSFLFDTIGQNMTPTRLTMRMVEFKKEDHFRHLVNMLKKNTTLKYLDISKASLPYDAGPETCEALLQMFEENSTLEELDISGEHAHLDSARFGIGLNLALTGLKKNTSLRVLKIEHQKLGLQGANTLASVLEENNSLQEVYCENNEINLQSFTVLLNALQRNYTILFLPPMDRDREQSLEKVRREIEVINRESSATAQSTTTSLRRTLTAAVGVKPSRPPSVSAASPAYTEQDVHAALRALDEKWDLEAQRLQRYLVRNFNIANGLPFDGEEQEQDDRPRTAHSLGEFLEKVKLDRTPTLEKEVGLGMALEDDEDDDDDPPPKMNWSLEKQMATKDLEEVHPSQRRDWSLEKELRP